MSPDLLALGRLPIITSVRVQVPFKSYCTVVEEWTHGYFCLGCFSSLTHSYLVKRLARKVWRRCVLVFAHDLGFRGGNCNGLLTNTGLLLSTGNRYLFLLQRRLVPFDSLQRLLFQFLPSLASKFRKRSF